VEIPDNIPILGGAATSLRRFWVRLLRHGLLAKDLAVDYPSTSYKLHKDLISKSIEFSRLEKLEEEPL